MSIGEIAASQPLVATSSCLPGALVSRGSVMTVQKDVNSAMDAEIRKRVFCDYAKAR